MRRYFIKEIENMRDIGGYPINSRKCVSEGLIIRSNVPINLSENSLLELEKKGYGTIIDLRNDEEIAKKKGVFFGNDKFQYNHIKIKGDGRIPDSKDGILESYIEMIEGKEQIKKIFNIIAETKGGIIYYCNAGKDRTGVITAIILKLLGVDDKDIVIDYIASGIYLKEMLEDYAKKMKNKKDILEIIKPNEETMFKVLNYISNKYSSIENYLISCGVEKNTLLKIKNKYIV